MEELFDQYGSTVIGLIGGLFIVGMIWLAVLSDDGIIRDLIIKYVQDTLG